MADENQVIRFFHGPEDGIDAKIEDSTINGSDIVITSDTDSIFFVDNQKQKHNLGSSKTK